jgi:hypothetical protein
MAQRACSATAQDSSLLEPFWRVMVDDHAG